MAYKYKKGIFKCRNPKKYNGDATNIVYRSGLEFKYMMMLDLDPNVKSWASEELPINYLKPTDMKVHRYFIDFIVWMVDGTKYMVEIKPDAQTRPPKRGTKRPKTFLKEAETWAVNEAKWKAAEAFCKEKGFLFRIVTEKDLYGNNQQRKT